MRLMKLFVISAAMCCAAGIGCSIKEDRSECPCRLVLDLSRVSLCGDDSLELAVVSDAGVVCAEKVDSASLGKNVVLDVPRVSLGLMACCGGEGMTGMEGLVIPMGSSCPEIYTYVSEIEADAEVVCDTLMMRKNHCVVSIAFKYQPDDEVRLTVRGNVCGYDLAAKPVVGAFMAYAVSSSDGDLPSVVLPRQCGGELFLDVCDSKGRSKTLILSRYIDASGYDWNAPDLKDMKITIDMVHTTISLKVTGWDEEFFFDVVI